MLCDETQPNGCDRCRPRNITVCCDICHPEPFTTTFTTSVAPSASRATPKTHIKEFKATDVDLELKIALLDWRDKNALIKFRVPVIRTMGSKILLSDQIIARIVECAHVGKMKTVLQLAQETGWRKDWAEELGESLLDVVQTYYPTPAGPIASISSTPAVVGRKCSACGEIGHNSRSMIFAHFSKAHNVHQN